MKISPEAPEHRSSFTPRMFSLKGGKVIALSAVRAQSHLVLVHRFKWSHGPPCSLPHTHSALRCCKCWKTQHLKIWNRTWIYDCLWITCGHYQVVGVRGGDLFMGSFYSYLHPIVVVIWGGEKHLSSVFNSFEYLFIECFITSTISFDKILFSVFSWRLFIIIINS